MKTIFFLQYSSTCLLVYFGCSTYFFTFSKQNLQLSYGENSIINFFLKPTKTLNEQINHCEHKMFVIKNDLPKSDVSSVITLLLFNLRDSLFVYLRLISHPLFHTFFSDFFFSIKRIFFSYANQNIFRSQIITSDQF